VKQATEIYSRDFDSVFFDLTPRWRQAVDRAIRDLGSRLESYPHHRLQGRSEFRMRVGDYRIIYDFDVARNELFLIALGHRREVYR
jgi:mRNA interferase RelE/StbE